jgi:hypothetical protein
MILEVAATLTTDPSTFEENRKLNTIAGDLGVAERACATARAAGAPWQDNERRREGLYQQCMTGYQERKRALWPQIQADLAQMDALATRLRSCFPGFAPTHYQDMQDEFGFDGHSGVFPPAPGETDRDPPCTERPGNFRNLRNCYDECAEDSFLRLLGERAEPICATGCAYECHGYYPYDLSLDPRNRHYPTLLRAGLHPSASDALELAGIPASRIRNVIGDDGQCNMMDHYPENSPEMPYVWPDPIDGRLEYSAATDIDTAGLSDDEIRHLLLLLTSQGFAAWFRRIGQDGWNRGRGEFIHALFAGCPMKGGSRRKIGEWYMGFNGLGLEGAPGERGETRQVYTFWRAPDDLRSMVLHLSLENGSGVPPGSR